MNVKKVRYITAVGVFFIVSACGTASRLPQQTKNTSPKKEETKRPSAHILSKNGLQASLQKAYHDWKGTPYRWGGSSTAVGDCSAFMQIIFDKYLNVGLPRSTRRQLYVGRKVDRSNLKIGDLIFFKTGRKTIHVGVIIGNKRFLHASTSQGVTISSLKKYYWRSRFLM